MYFPQGLPRLDQVAFTAKQEGIKKVFLHNLFERPDLSSNNIILVSAVIINAIGIDLESHLAWNQVGGQECLSAICLIRVAQRGKSMTLLECSTNMPFNECNDIIK